MHDQEWNFSPQSEDHFVVEITEECLEWLMAWCPEYVEMRQGRVAGWNEVREIFEEEEEAANVV
jgi:hypothetical protein